MTVLDFIDKIPKDCRDFTILVEIPKVEKQTDATVEAYHIDRVNELVTLVTIASVLEIDHEC